MNNIGKISEVTFEKIAGRLGIWFVLKSDGCSFDTERVVWDFNDVKVTEDTTWTEESREASMADMMRYISDLMFVAKVNSIEDLRDTPITLQIENGMLQDWRILREVL